VSFVFGNLCYFLSPHTFPEKLINIYILLLIRYSVSSFCISPITLNFLPSFLNNLYFYLFSLHLQLCYTVYLSINFLRPSVVLKMSQQYHGLMRVLEYLIVLTRYKAPLQDYILLYLS